MTRALDVKSIGPIARSVLSEQVSKAILNGLLDGSFKPGDRLVENDLSQLLGISRSPIREALSELQKTGIVVKAPSRGTFIREWSPKDLRELFALRALLEGFAARLIAERMAAGAGKELLAPLCAVVAEMKRQEKKVKGAEMVDLDLMFHQELWKLSQNELLTWILLSLSERVRLFLTIERRAKGPYRNASARHQLVIDAIASGNGDLAQATMQEHVTVPQLADEPKPSRKKPRKAV